MLPIVTLRANPSWQIHHGSDGGGGSIALRGFSLRGEVSSRFKRNPQNLGQTRNFKRDGENCERQYGLSRTYPRGYIRLAHAGYSFEVNARACIFRDCFPSRPSSFD